eukprot:1317544-Rhodomonas_salina.1
MDEGVAFWNSNSHSALGVCKGSCGPNKLSLSPRTAENAQSLCTAVFCHLPNGTCRMKTPF